MKTLSQSVLFLALVLLPVLSIADEPGWCPAFVNTTEVVLSTGACQDKKVLAKFASTLPIPIDVTPADKLAYRKLLRLPVSHRSHRGPRGQRGARLSGAADAPVVNRWEPLQAPNPHRGDPMTPAVKTTEDVLQEVAEKLSDCLLQVKEELSELRLVQEAMLTELARISESLDTIASHMTL